MAKEEGLIKGTHYFDTDRELRDYYNNDEKFLLRFGHIHAASLFKMISARLDDTGNEFKEKTGEAFRPYLYYKTSTITRCCEVKGEDGEIETECDVEHIYLITEAVTLEGHYVFDYEWVTEEKGKCTITKEVCLGSTLVSPKWERLDRWIVENLEDTKDIELTRKMLWEAGNGYTQSKENLAWLFEPRPKEYLGYGVVAPGILEHFLKAEEIFGIPHWFLLALAYNESSLRTDALNEKTEAFGLMQLVPSTQKTTIDYLMTHYRQYMPQEAVKLYSSSSKDAEAYRTIAANPYVNVLAGCVDLISKGLNPARVDWNGNWEKQTLPVLAKYGGYAHIPKKLWKKYGVTNESESYDQEKVLAWARDSYAEKIWRYAGKFRTQQAQPFNGSYPVTSYFGEKREGSYHHGVDFGLPEGTPLYSVTDGEVVFAGWAGDYGKMVKITNYCFDFIYGHMDTITVEEGDTVAAGQRIDTSGNTGKSTGPHLHFEMRPAGGDLNSSFNPLPWLRSNQ